MSSHHFKPFLLSDQLTAFNSSSKLIHAFIFNLRRKFGAKTARKAFLMDQTMESVAMTVWHPEYQERMDQWRSFDTILHLVDVRAEFSDFERSTVLSLTSKTIIIENPVQSSRYSELMTYIQDLSDEKINQLKSNPHPATVDLSSIKDVMSVTRIFNQIQRDPVTEIRAIVYGVVTKFDINAGLIKVCAHCKRFLTRNRSECENGECRLTNGPLSVDKVYMQVSITDHSGTLKGRINDDSAQRILGYTAQELKQLTEDEIDAIFKRFILQRFEVKVVIKPKSQTDYAANFLSIEIQQPAVMAKAMKP